MKRILTITAIGAILFALTGGGNATIEVSFNKNGKLKEWSYVKN